MGIKIGVLGTGAFAQCFIPLIKNHPLTDKLILCDIDSEKLRQNAAKHGADGTAASFDELLSTDIEAVMIFTQNWMHAPQAIKALEAGKHVYSAVPSAISVDEIAKLVKTVEKTRKVYMIGETSYYYPSVIYCRSQFKKGAFGRAVYAEGEYYHDWDHGLYDVAKWRGGDKWLETAGIPPMYYPTHSVSCVVSVTGAHAEKVSCIGVTDRNDDGCNIYGENVNLWDNRFSNQTALLKMSDGSAARINEFRRIGHPGTVRMSFFGTKGCFEESVRGSIFVTKNSKESVILDDVLKCGNIKRGGADGMDRITSGDGTHCDVSAVHDINRLPAEFAGLRNGHNGSHQFLIDDFIKAAYKCETPPNSVWDAARYVLPGLIAHESSLCGGKQLDIPDFGDPIF